VPAAKKPLPAWRLQRRRLVKYIRWSKPYRSIKLGLDFLVAALARFIVRRLRRLDPDASSNFMGKLTRRVGPWLLVSRVGRKNLRAAYPEKSAAEIEAILGGVWDNLGRVVGEFVHLDRLWDYDEARPNAGRIETFHVDRFIGLFTDEKPALIFSAHLANWELSAVFARNYGLDSAVVVRPPSNRFISELILETRGGMANQLISSQRNTIFSVASVLERGGHLGMLVDQHRRPGVQVMFFGRPCWTNDALARLARNYECPVHGVRVIRLPGNRFRIELTEALELPRDSEGLVDTQATMQKITSIVEEWVREYPEQWLWLHRRWRA
jgi:KDO2-lipid IV(A) lauroyltransferase